MELFLIFSTVTESGGPYFEGEKYWKRKDTGQIKQLPKRSKSSCFQIFPIFSPIVPFTDQVEQPRGEVLAVNIGWSRVNRGSTMGKAKSCLV